MKKNYKRLISILCTAALVLSLLIGCGATTTTEDLVTPKSAPRTDSSTTEVLSDQDSQANAAEQESADTAQSAGSITDAQAKEIALNHAELTETQVTGMQVKLDQDDGQQEYEVEFRKDSTEYDYEIDVATGDILKYSVETKTNATAQSVTVTEDQAKEIALNHVHLTADQVTDLQVKLDQDDAQKKYEVEFRKDSTEYEYEINAETGDVIKYGAEMKKTVNAGQTGNGQSATVTEAKAKEIALNHAGLTEDQITGMKVKLDQDNGRAEYEVEFRKDKTEYDYEIDAETGDILNYDIDVD